MKRIIGYALALALVAGGCPGFTKTARADWGFQINFGFFYNRLRPYGHWVHVPRYGQVWYPAGVGHYWQPYVNGYWAYTEYGWTWISYDPFGDVAFHYGAWTLLPTYGWVWVPGYTWAPAWVTWRHGPRYVGWAPLPPDYGFSYGSACPSATVINQSWVFVPSGSIGSSNIPDVRFPYQQYGEIIEGTQPFTNLTVDDGHLFNPGPGNGGPGQFGEAGRYNDPGKFNLRRLKADQAGLKPQPLGNEVRASRSVSVATPYTAKTLPRLDDSPAAGDFGRTGQPGRSVYEPVPGRVPRDRIDDRYDTRGRDIVPVPKPSPRYDRDEKVNNAPRSENLSSEPRYIGPSPRQAPSPKPSDQPKNLYQQRGAERPFYTAPSSPPQKSYSPPQSSPRPSDQPFYTPPSRTYDPRPSPYSNRPNTVNPNQSGRDPFGNNSSVYQDRGRSYEKAPRHVYQPPVKSAPARPSGPTTMPGGRMGGSPAKRK